IDWGYAPDDVQTWFKQNQCTTRPLKLKDYCRRAADVFGISQDLSGDMKSVTPTWGSAPDSVQKWWIKSYCHADAVTPTPMDTCQKLADFYGVRDLQRYMVMGQAALTFADEFAASYWTANGCDTYTTYLDACQAMSDTYAISTGTSWGFAPGYV